MKNLIKLEEIGLFFLSAFLLYQLDIGINWWWYIPLFFAPDIGMLGYLVNTRVGAVTYNLFHHKGIASLLMLAGMIWSNDVLLFSGLLMFAHASFDRVLGYGLKYPDSFKHTSIGQI